MTSLKHFLNKKTLKSRKGNSIVRILLVISVLLCVKPIVFSQSYTVTKIDSTTKHYLISIATCNELKGIIISKKNPDETKSFSQLNMLVEVGKEYDFLLKEYLLYSYIKRSSFKTETNGEGGILVDGIEVWRAKDSYGLYETVSLKGLFFLPKNE